MNDKVISKNPEVLGGTPVFRGTRVPIRILFEYLEDGSPLAEFLDHFPTVKREQAVAVLLLAKDKLTGQLSETAA